MNMFKGITYNRMQQVSSLPSPRNTSIHDLNIDELIEILVRVPIETVHRCKCVSKHWLALITDPSFTRSYIRHYSDSPWCNDFIVWKTKRVQLNFGHVPYLEKSPASSINKDHPQGMLLVDDILAFSYLPPEPFFWFNIEGASHGLLLCNGLYKLIAGQPRGGSVDSRGKYYVCNPLTKRWLQIPPIHDHWYRLQETREGSNNVGFMCYSIDTNLPHKVEFIILEAEYKNVENDDDFFYAHVFSSKTSCWTLHRVACPPNLNWEPTFDVMVYKGKFHWNAFTSIVAYDPVNEPCKCNLIPTPNEEEEHVELISCIGANEQSDGHIRMVTRAFSGSQYFFYVYEITDYEKGVWCLKYSINIYDYFYANGYIYISRFICSPTNGENAWVEITYLDDKGEATKKVALLTMKSVSVLSVVELPNECSFSSFVYVMTWPASTRGFEHDEEESSSDSDGELHFIN